MNGAERIAARRARQISHHGFDAAHDDIHVHGELAIVAAVVALFDTDARVEDTEHGMALPNGRDAWGIIERNPGFSREVERLEIAGALIAAEIDRLLRADKGGDA